MKNKWKTARTISYIILILYAIISLFPFFWAIIVSMTPLTYTDAQNVERGVDIMQWPPKIDLFSSEPSAFGAPLSFQNYFKIFEVVPLYGRWIINTVLYAVLLTIGNIIFDTLGGYAFARLKFPFKNFLFAMILATLMIPSQVTMIPQYNLMVKLNLVNTYPGLVIPKLSNIFGLFLMRQFFLSFPKELEEAARIDGAGILKTYFKIVLPNSKPAIAALSIYTFLGAWNDFQWPLIITSQKEMYTLTMGLNFFKSSYYTFWQYLMAGSILMTIPMIIIFLSFQKQFVETGKVSAIKG
ncbi:MULTISPECIES: carbohydrate ABC transporter permease [Oceanotoga]|jgi:multiple sugar transport system permease protein|uniref:carbohydrate ABC transporter permease n=1 Tax=Oceanotoga TaxID=1255275 RepID=UPI0026541E44|nr:MULTISPECIES: carbohydrate ABC transporter permease [Oceanotoga]MDN5341910.1 multiple sugar transport system permease protein [Oceanotoga sp.]MDO7976578.1 carbohydrate ABC transporter permease [Oceanotoga teriensis]